MTLSASARPRQDKIQRSWLMGEWLLTAALALALTGLLAWSGGASRLDNLLYDALLRQAPQPISDEIIMVVIDDRSLQEIGVWPWSRQTHAALVERIAAAGPKALAYDVLFLETGSDPAADSALGDAFAATGVAALPLLVESPGPNGAAYALRPPVREIARGARGLGQVNLQFDRDGVVRRAALLESIGNQDLPHLMEVTRRIGQGLAPPDRPGPTDGGPLVRNAPALIPYAGPPGHYPAISASSILAGETPPEFLRHRYILVGATAAGLHDSYATPTSTAAQLMPGVEIQANLLAALLDDRTIHPLNRGVHTGLSIGLVLALLLGLLKLGPRENLLLGAALILLAPAGSAVALLTLGLWAPPAAALIGILLVLPLWAWRRLEASSRYMVQELARFSAEPDLLSRPSKPARGQDTVARQIALMEDTIARARDARGFALDTLQGLPDPTLVLSSGGEVSFANATARQLFPQVQALTAQALLEGWSADGARLDDLLLSETEIATEIVSPTGAVFHVTRVRHQPHSEGADAWILRLTDITPIRTAAAQRERLLQLLTHDMRSPQASILAVLDSPAEEKPPPAIAERIAGYARRTLALADNFIHLARAESGALAPEILNLSDLATEVVDDLWPRAQQAGVVISLKTPPEDLLVHGDRALLSRALANLLDNALKYGSQPGEISCVLWADADMAVCEIADQGPGIDADALPRLLQPFQRLNRPEAARLDGVGLGLSLVSEVAQRHGGEIGCRNAGPAGGAIFTLRLPRVTEA
ncbi:CHASE2 domain-containing protein [Phenylobacterium sp.]|uniref:CHASE2 domain-containing protein n=1 Tax=Phenylobacterium sp. TaxID=1871053 RepID=UPI00272F0B4F|nr:CHASE2 domain-containing protein [Phenylobacterium sp.]MDP1616767.1 CHASE2 domain-containing protein [Phenylobacterium sp.]MDP1988287.1 CHASE2 domain-containing protein [Phenylobacterium sp.]